MSSRLHSIAGFGLAVFAWELLSDCGFLNRDIPAPWSIATQIFVDRADYYMHIQATLASASMGFVFGNLLAAFIAVILAMVPRLRPAAGILTFLYSIPLILLIPIVGMAFSPSVTKILGAMLLVYYPTFVITGVSLSQTPPAFADVLYGFGGNEYTVLVKLKLRVAIAGFAAGLQTAAPFALLGAMLGEMTGARWGLGTYLIAVMAQGRPVKLWGVFTVCSAIAVVSYLIVGAVARPLVHQLDSFRALPVNKHLAPNIFGRIRSLAFSLTVTLVIWEACARALDIEYFIKSPVQLFNFALHLTTEQWQEFFTALASSLSYALIGLSAGISVAFLLAILCDFAPRLGDALLPFAFVSQAVPIVALIPLYVAVAGRGTVTIVAVVVSATFFPSFVSITEGFRQTPRRLVDVARASGASKATTFLSVSLPSSLPFVIAAARLAAPRVLLGVTLAEYLATRTGLGALMFEARGKTDFGMMWLIAVTAGCASLCLATIVQTLPTAFGVKRDDEAPVLEWTGRSSE